MEPILLPRHEGRVHCQGADGTYSYYEVGPVDAELERLWKYIRELENRANQWNAVDPNGILCIPKPGGSQQVSLPGETPFECAIRWKDRAEKAEGKIKNLTTHPYE